VDAKTRHRPRPELVWSVRMRMALGEDAPPLTINAGFSSVSRSSSENLGSPHTTIASG